jgi:hypothetical protein
VSDDHKTEKFVKHLEKLGPEWGIEIKRLEQEEGGERHIALICSDAKPKKFKEAKVLTLVFPYEKEISPSLKEFLPAFLVKAAAKAAFALTLKEIIEKYFDDLK